MHPSLDAIFSLSNLFSLLRSSLWVCSSHYPAMQLMCQHRYFCTVMVSRCSYTEQSFTDFSLSIPAALETWRSYDPCLSELDSKDQKETTSGHPCRKRKKEEEREKTGIRATKVSQLSPYSWFYVKVESRTGKSPQSS